MRYASNCGWHDDNQYALASNPRLDLIVTSAGHRTPVSDKLKKKEKRLKRYQRSQSRRLAVAKKKTGLDPKKPIPKGTKLQKSKRHEKHQRHPSSHHRSSE